MSIYQLISSKIYVARMDNNYNIKSMDYIQRIPQYVAQVMELIDFPYSLDSVHKEISVDNYKAKLPCNIELIEAIKHNGIRLERNDVVNQKDSDDISKQSQRSYDYYEILSDRWISLPFEEDTITVYYKILPCERDSDNILYPKVINDEKVHECIDMYILKMLMYRGYTHPVFSLDSKNPLTNPGLLFEIKLKQARNAMWDNDPDSRFQISKAIREFITDPGDAYREFQFNQTGE